MLKVRLKIGTGNKVYTDEAYGLVYLDSTKRVGPDQKDFESVSYPEEEGEYISPKTVDAPFDYKVKFFVQGTSLQDANKKIAAFNALLYSQVSGSDVKTYKQVAFYNDHKRHKIVGYPKEIHEAEKFWRDPTGLIGDVVVVEWTIRVTKPSLCEFKTPFTDDSSN